MYLVLKFGISALVIVIVSEIAKRSSLFGALVASLPLTSVLALTWLYYETGDVSKVAELSWDILWLVIPSLIFFVALPLALKSGFGYFSSLGIAVVTMLAGYALTIGLRSWIA